MSDEKRRDGRDRPEKEIQKEERVQLLLKGMLHKNFCPVIYSINPVDVVSKKNVGKLFVLFVRSVSFDILQHFGIKSSTLPLYKS